VMVVSDYSKLMVNTDDLIEIQSDLSSGSTRVSTTGVMVNALVL
jgi:hypothetical protein